MTANADARCRAIEHIEVRFGTDSAAFEPSPTTEIARILRKVADDFEQYGWPASVIRDVNGNFVGEVKILREED